MLSGRRAAASPRPRRREACRAAGGTSAQDDWRTILQQASLGFQAADTCLREPSLPGRACRWPLPHRRKNPHLKHPQRVSEEQRATSGQCQGFLKHLPWSRTGLGRHGACPCHLQVGSGGPTLKPHTRRPRFSTRPAGGSGPRSCCCACRMAAPEQP